MNKDLEKALENMARQTESLKISNARYKQANNNFERWLKGERETRSESSFPAPMTVDVPPLPFRVLGVERNRKVQA